MTSTVESSKWSATKECRANRDSLINLFVGKKIGGGASRRVYEMVGHEDRVIKVEHSGWTFHNQTEWLIWQEVKHWPISDWFAKCIDIDSLGNVLMQQRTKPFSSDREFQKALRETRGGYLPTIFSDTHYANFGMLDGRVTCHDYGYHKFMTHGARSLCVELGYLDVETPEAVVHTHRQEPVSQYALDL